MAYRNNASRMMRLTRNDTSALRCEGHATNYRMFQFQHGQMHEKRSDSDITTNGGAAINAELRVKILRYCREIGLIDCHGPRVRACLKLI